MSIKRN